MQNPGILTKKDKRRRRHLVRWMRCCAATSIVLAAAGTGEHLAQAVSTYTITNLGSFSGGSSYATGINNSGQVVGYAQYYSSTTNSYYDQAFLYSSGTMSDLGALAGGASSFATGINNSGQIVGYSNTSAGYTHAFLYSSGTMTDLETFSGNTGSFNAYAYGINSTGQIAGHSSTSSSTYEYNAFEYSGSTMTSLGTLGGSGSYGYAVNNNGQVVGYSGTSGNENHAFVYSGGAMTDLGTLGGSNSYARGINANGQIVGAADTSGGSYNAFLYSSGKMTSLGTLSGYTNASVAYGINSSGDVVGASENSSVGSQGFDSFHAFLYNGTSMVDLNSLLPANSGWNLFEATAINDSGQIVGFGSNSSGAYEAFLLTPIPVLYWNNHVGNGLWDINTSTNWNNVAGNVNPTTYSNAYGVYFDDAHNNGNYSVTLNTTVAPLSVTVNNSAGNYVISGTGSITGAGGLFKEGADSLTLSTADSYTGGTQIGEGKLIVGNSSALPIGGAVTFGDGTSDSGTLDLNGIGATVGELAVTSGSSGTQTITNNGTQAATLTFAGSTNPASTFSGVIQNGNSTTTLTVNNSTLTLNGTNTYTGVTNINGGTVYAGNFSALGSLTGGAVNITAGATLDIGGISSQASGGFGAKVFNIAGTGASGSLGAIQDTGGAGGANGSSQQESAFENINLTANATIGGNNQEWPTTVFSNEGRFDIGRQGGTLNLNGYVLTKDGTDQLSLTGSNGQIAGSDSGGAIVADQGILSLEVGYSMKNNNDYIVMNNPGGVADNVILVYYEPTTGDKTMPTIFNGAGIEVGPSHTGTYTVNSNMYLNNNVTYFLGNGATSGTLNFSGNISDVTSAFVSSLPASLTSLAIGTGAGSFTITAGTLELSGTNTYSGPTTINAGALTLGSQLAVQNSTVTDNATSSGLAFNTGITNFTLGGLAGAGAITLKDTGGSAVTLSVGNNGANTLYSGALSSSGSLSKIGSGALTLSGTDTYTGTTTINGGTLQIGNGGATGSLGSGGNVIDNAQLTFDLGTTATVSNLISGTGALSQMGTGTTTLTAADIYSGTTTVNSGTLALGATGSIADSTLINVAGGATFNVSAVSGYTLGGSTAQQLEGSGNVTGNVTAGASGTLSPGIPSGNTIGTLTVSGNVTLGGTFAAQVIHGSGGDQLNAGGNVTLGGTENISSPNTGSLANGDSFTVIQGNVYGSFASVNLPMLTNGLSWNQPLNINNSLTGAAGTYQTNYTYSVTNGTPSYISSVAASGTLAGFNATDNVGSRGTVVTFLGGTVSSATSLSVQFGAAPGDATQLISDYVTLSGLGSTYVLEISYTSAQLGAFASTSPVLTVDNGGTLEAAVLLNSGGTAAEISGAYTSGDTLGDYGVDTTNDVVWAVLNYSGGDKFGVLSRLVGDAAGTGVVTPQDISIVLSNQGDATNLWSLGDFNDTNSVTPQDISQVLAAQGQTATGSGLGVGGLITSSQSEVPEPGSLALLVFGALGMALRSRSSRKN